MICLLFFVLSVVMISVCVLLCVNSVELWVCGSMLVWILIGCMVCVLWLLMCGLLFRICEWMIFVLMLNRILLMVVLLVVIVLVVSVFFLSFVEVVV